MDINDKLFLALQKISCHNKIKQNILNYYEKNCYSDIVAICDKIIEDSKQGKTYIKYKVDSEDKAEGLAQYLKYTTGITCYNEFNIVYCLLLEED